MNCLYKINSEIKSTKQFKNYIFCVQLNCRDNVAYVIIVKITTFGHTIMIFLNHLENIIIWILVFC